jgi:E3 ubiquitin-protein ligase TRIP12
MVELLLNKLSDVYLRSFHREGVIFEIGKIADEDLTQAFVKARQAGSEEISVKKEQIDASTDTASKAPTAAEISGNLATERSSAIAALFSQSEEDTKPSNDALAAWSAVRTVSNGVSDVPKRISSVPTDPKDVNILRARILRIKKGLEASTALLGDDSSGLGKIQELLKVLLDKDSTEDSIREALRTIAAFFQDQANPLSSFELLHSGLLEGLLSFVTLEGTGESSEPRNYATILTVVHAIIQSAAPTAAICSLVSSPNLNPMATRLLWLCS